MSIAVELLIMRISRLLSDLCVVSCCLWIVRDVGVGAMVGIGDGACGVLKVLVSDLECVCAVDGVCVEVLSLASVWNNLLT